MNFIFIEDQQPPENEFVFVKVDKDSPIGISRIKDGEWDLDYQRKRPIFTKNHKYYTSATPQYWALLPIAWCTDCCPLTNQ